MPVQQHERGEPAERVHDVPARDLDRSPESARQALGPPAIAAGTANPKSASQTTRRQREPGQQERGRQEHEGADADRSEPRAPRRRATRDRALAQANEAAKNGAASANTTIDVAVS